MNNKPNQGPQESTILVSFTRDQLKKIDFDPTQPQKFANLQPQAQQNVAQSSYSSYVPTQYRPTPSQSNLSINQQQGQFQNNQQSAQFKDPAYTQGYNPHQQSNQNAVYNTQNQQQNYKYN